MTEDLEEITERLGQLERYVNLLEARADLQESLMRLYTAGRKPTELPDGEDTPAGARDAEGARRAGMIHDSRDSIICCAQS